jgi:23S rRNA C2498 (ribose-2'-O)-methylase RlmM
VVVVEGGGWWWWVVVRKPVLVFSFDFGQAEQKLMQSKVVTTALAIVSCY